MIFSRDYIGYLARRTVKHLVDAKLITTSDMKVTEERVNAALLEELSLEDRINEEVRVILEAYSDEMRKTGAQYQEMFKKVKTELARKFEEHVFGNRGLAGIYAVVHLPELALPRRGLGGTRDELGSRVCVLVGEVPEREHKAIAQRFAQLTEHRNEAPAIGAEEVAIQHHRDGRSRPTPADVVSRRGDVRHRHQP